MIRLTLDYLDNLRWRLGYLKRQREAYSTVKTPLSPYLEKREYHELGPLEVGMIQALANDARPILMGLQHNPFCRHGKMVNSIDERQNVHCSDCMRDMEPRRV